MNNYNNYNYNYCYRQSFTRLCRLGLLLFSLAVRLNASGQFYDDFSSGTDAGWTHLEPLSSFGAPGMFTFPNGGYRLQASASPNPSTLGPARAGSLRLDVNL